MLEHVDQRFEQQIQIGVGEAGAFAGMRGQGGGDEAVRTVEAIGDDVLAAHRAAAFGLGIRLGCGGHASDGDFQWQHRLDGWR